jgi:hypothetical protein
MVCRSGRDGGDQEMLYAFEPVDLIFKLIGATKRQKRRDFNYKANGYIAL